MRITNRIATLRPDFLFKIVRKPDGWQPAKPQDVPPTGEVLSIAHVASFEEAQEDLLRCNKLALEQNLDKWAVVECGGGEI